MVMYKGKSCTRQELEALVREYFPPGTKVKTNEEWRKGAAIICGKTGIVFFEASSNWKLKQKVLEALKDPKEFTRALKSAQRAATLFDLPPVVELKTAAEKEWGKALHHAQAATQLSGETKPRFEHDEKGFPVAIKTNSGIYYKSKMSLKGGKKSKRV